MHTHKHMKLSQTTRLPSPETAIYLENCWKHNSNHASFVHCLELRVLTSTVTPSASVHGCSLKPSAASNHTGCGKNSLGSYSCSTARCFLWSWSVARGVLARSSLPWIQAWNREGRRLYAPKFPSRLPQEILPLRNEIAFSARLKQDKDCRQD